MTDAERVLAMLIHDVRTPLGVAHGYLRLIRADKLPAADDRDRALAGSQEALAKISRLCQDAGAFLEDAPGPGTSRSPVAQLVQRIAAVLADRGVAVAAPVVADGTVAVGSNLDRAAETIATLIAARAGKVAGGAVAFTATDDRLTITVGPEGTTLVETGPDAWRPFDPWASSHGLGVIAAHRLFTALDGRVWTGHGLALALTMPVESGNA